MSDDKLRSALNDPRVAAAKAAWDEAVCAQHAMFEIAAAWERAWEKAGARSKARRVAYDKALERFKNASA